ncbi:cytochrome c biogenesis protein CcsA [Candidatus Poriferisocius sp.]|uniref:cytochrome c biogenesis protein CcsA n=1 Tax=Candidatus Poriferisocius sp. TaxID=3101276 RepID=UPI003B028873
MSTGSATTSSRATRVLATTSSRATRVLGQLALVGFAVLLVLAFVWVPEDTRITGDGDVVGQFDAVRLMFVHVPSAILAYVGFGLTFVASLAYLRWRTDWWDMMAHSSAEIGVVFGVLTLVTGSIWGRPTWQTWWEWGDVRLVTTLMLVLVFVGYLAVRRIPADAAVKARRSVVIALVGAVNIVIVNRSVDWWENRTLHQQSTLIARRIRDETLFTLSFSFAVGLVLFAWLMLHRFRLAYLERQIEQIEVSKALEERWAEADLSNLSRGRP